MDDTFKKNNFFFKNTFLPFIVDVKKEKIKKKLQNFDNK